MQNKAKTAPLTVSLSFPQGFSQGILDLVSRRSMDFSAVIVEEMLRDLVARPGDEATGLADYFVIAPRLSIPDIDAKITAALRAFRRELQAS